MPRVQGVSFAIVCCSILAIFSATSAHAQNTINVPADQPTIQAAINVANNGDTVRVAPGTYAENINFSGKAITVTSSSGAAQTIIDGGGTGPVVIFNHTEGLNSVLNGFTIQNGSTLNTTFRGAGISINSASPTVTNNVIQNNEGCSGGGMAVEFSSALIQGNTISNNNDFACSGGDGAGIYIGGAGSAQIIGNVIANNAATSAGNGGGIALFAAGTPKISNNIITGNTTAGLSPSTQGGGIWIVNQSDALIVQNIIYNNTAGQGSGVYFLVPSGDRGPILINNTIAGSGTSSGSAVYAGGFDNQVQFFNNLLIGSVGQNAVNCDTTYQAQPPAFSNNDAFSSGATGFAGSCSSVVGQNGNITVDPLFANAGTGDFHLQPGSPAIDAGSNSAPNLSQTDNGGKPRIVDGNNDCVSTVDMGALEFQAAASVSFSPGSLTFADQPVGTSSGPQQVKLSNTGDACFQFSSTQISGDFSQNSNCPPTMTGGSSCTYSVFFSPTQAGLRTGALSISGSDGTTTTAASVSLSGNGIIPQPIASLSPSGLNFSSQVVGTTSAAQNVTLTNTGNAALNIASITATGAFLQNNNCPASMLPNTSCVISVYFAPASAGTASAVLSVTDNASGSPHTVSLSGVGIDFAVGISPNPATIKHGQAGTFTVSVTPQGAAFNSPVAVSCSGLPTSSTCSLSPSSLTPGGSGMASTMTILTSGKTPRGNYNVVVTGASGSDTHSATLALTVN